MSDTLARNERKYQAMRNLLAALREYQAAFGSLDISNIIEKARN